MFMLCRQYLKRPATSDIKNKTIFDKMPTLNSAFFKYIVLLCLALGLFYKCAFFRPLPAKLYKRASATKPYDVIIVPGVPFNGKEWDTKMKGRVLWANYLIKNGVAKNVIFSGAAV